MKRLYKKLISERTRINIRLSLCKLTSAFYMGNRFSCNCCGKSFRKFKSKGNGLKTRENAECPHCTSLERIRNLFFYLQNETKIFSDSARLLHFAPEYALLPWFRKAKNLEYISADLNPHAADHQIDITDIPFPADYFDYILCFHVLGHVPDEEKAIRELFRVLKKDGFALIGTIIDRNSSTTLEREDADTPEKRLQYYSESDLVRLHGMDFGDRLRAGGFNVEQIDYPIQLGQEMRDRYSLGNGERELIFKCTSCSNS
ncbi:methyltransferase domain-containing protein [Bacteroidales bacterium OttesenSCG-928-A17]|nr:methyltransferase domain-containing protein [Bacteroidales bacterium OttesenSCG-928-A17]